MRITRWAIFHQTRVFRLNFYRISNMNETNLHQYVHGRIKKAWNAFIKRESVRGMGIDAAQKLI